MMVTSMMLASGQPREAAQVCLNVIVDSDALQWHQVVIQVRPRPRRWLRTARSRRNMPHCLIILPQR